MTALPSSGSFVMVDPVHIAEVGPAAAVVYARIVWRSQEAGEWRATRGDLCAETGLSPAMVRTAVEVLRDREWVAARRTSTLDSTLIWSPIVAGQDGERIPPSRDSDIRQTPLADSAIPSLETDLEVPPYSPPLDEQTALPLLTVVPTVCADPDHFDRFWSLWPAGRKVGKPKARQAFDRALRRASVEAIAAGLLAHLPSWNARVEAGEAGFVPHPTTWLNRDGWEDTPPPLPTARRNADWSDPSLLAGAEAMLQRWKGTP